MIMCKVITNLKFFGDPNELNTDERKCSLTDTWVLCEYMGDPFELSTICDVSLRFAMAFAYALMLLKK